MGQIVRTFRPVRGRVMRLTRLDSCGRPDYGDEGVIVSKGFVEITATQRSTEGESIQQTNAAGELIIDEPGEPTNSGVTLNFTFVGVDPGVLAMITNSPEVLDPVDGAIIGFRLEEGVRPSDARFGLEAWTGVSGEECDPDVDGVFGYALYPFLSGGTIGDLAFANAAVSFSVQNVQSRRGGGWGQGPYLVTRDDQGDPSLLPVGVTTRTAMHFQRTTVAPPTARDGIFPLLDPTAAALTSIAVAETPSELDITVTPTAAGGPVWYDFGDGTWDYFAGGVGTHTYEEAGTYTVTGYRGLTSATDTATVPGA